MVIEWLRIPVPRAAQETFVACDTRIWTATLAAQPGFAGKECWRDVADPDMLHLVIRWDTLAQWQSVPALLLQATEAAFVAAMGTSYPVLACMTYEVLASVGHNPA